MDLDKAVSEVEYRGFITYGEELVLSSKHCADKGWQQLTETDANLELCNEATASHRRSERTVLG